MNTMNLAINQTEFQKFKNWFSGYAFSFKGYDSALTENTNLKEKHTYKVCEAILDIGKSIFLNEEELILAETVALFHDVGRFEQYKRFGTFMDSKSVNHSELGIEVLVREKVLDIIASETKDLIIKAIRYHNQARLPESENEECLLFSRLVRDADKLDIYRVVSEYYAEQKQGRKNKAIELDLPDTQSVSDEVVMAVINRKIVSFKDVKSLNDFKILQLAWIYDINFSFTSRRIKNEKYLDKIWDSMKEASIDPYIFLLVSEHINKNIS